MTAGAFAAVVGFFADAGLGVWATTTTEMTEQAQAKWVEYRDTHCAAVAAIYQGGSMQPMQRDACLVRLTEQRIAELKALLPESN